MEVSGSSSCPGRFISGVRTPNTQYPIVSLFWQLYGYLFIYLFIFIPADHFSITYRRNMA
jgi:hypothetical protein